MLEHLDLVHFGAGLATGFSLAAALCLRPVFQSAILATAAGITYVLVAEGGVPGLLARADYALWHLAQQPQVFLFGIAVGKVLGAGVGWRGCYGRRP